MSGNGAVRIAVLTVSDSGMRGEREDVSGDAIARWADSLSFSVASRRMVPDESDVIAAALLQLCDADAVDVVITTGGTGLGPRDVTPEATRTILDREAPGIAEAIRAHGRSRFPRSDLSRGVAGSRGATIVINLPGSPGGVNDGLHVLEPILEHAVRILKGQPTDH